MLQDRRDKASSDPLESLEADMPFRSGMENWTFISLDQ